MVAPVVVYAAYATGAMAAGYITRKVYNKKIGEPIKAAVQDVKDTAEAAKEAFDDVKIAVHAATTVAQDAKIQAVELADKVGGAVTAIKDHADKARGSITAVGFAILGTCAAVSAFYVGMMGGLGIHFLRLIDKTSLFTELFFYAAIISVFRAPAALLTALFVDEAGVKAFDWAVLVLSVAVAMCSFMFLDYFYAICFFLFFTALQLIRQLPSQPKYVLSALLFGFLYAETLQLQRPDTRLIFSERDPAVVTLLMSTPRGLIGLNANKQMSHYAWSTISSVSVEPQEAKQNDFRYLLRSGRSAFEAILSRSNQ
jgi:hypothetical protein